VGHGGRIQCNINFGTGWRNKKRQKPRHTSMPEPVLTLKNFFRWASKY